MRKSTNTRVVAALGIVGLIALPLTAAAERGRGAAPELPARVEQRAEVDLGIEQGADANSGDNSQENLNRQANGTGQDATGGADGAGALAVLAEDSSAAGGDAGDAAAVNAAIAYNASRGGNSIETGGADANNALAGAVAQDQTNESTVEQSDVGSGGTAETEVVQEASTAIRVSQSASANSGRNKQVNDTAQQTGTSQSAGSSSNSGGATAVITSGSATQGGSAGSADSSNTSASGNHDGGDNSISTGDASASNSSDISVEQSSSNSSSLTVTQSQDGGTP